ncbi:MAG: A/G-specific adenine glycosylase [Alphaproteobacteria bacterium]|nr:A/G-specific adenine glycosylase [Alphaproteobacteria bacterium]
MSEAPPSELTKALLGWYDRHRRVLPWRALPGERVDPYRVWLSEIMLQQTTVAAVVPYFEAFVERWPTVDALAAAELDQVLRAWAGLGYYGRARNLHRCARLVSLSGGGFPDDETALRALPGIGPYTAAAIAAIAFGRPAPVVDGNVERVSSRLFAVTDPLPAARTALTSLVSALVPPDRPGDFAQAAMDLGATVCTPRNPACVLCPWSASCAGRLQGIAATLPRKREKPPRPTRHGIVFWITRRDGTVLLRRRPEKGLLGGMMEFPSTPWREGAWTLVEAAAEAPLFLDWRLLPGEVRHGFTHFQLNLSVAVGGATPRQHARGVWARLDRLEAHALPTLMRKVARHALKKAY